MSSRGRFIGPIVGVLILLGFTAAAYWRVRSRGSSTASATPSDTTTGAVTSASGAFATDVFIPVQGSRVVKDTLVISVSAAAQAAAWRQIAIQSQVAGRIERLPVRESSSVPMGGLLLSVDTTTLALDLADARARLRQAEASYREATLFDAQITDTAVRAERSRVARAKHGLDQAEIQVRKAELDLEHARVTAPFGGRVASIKVVEGQWVGANTELMTLVDLDPIKVEVQVLESEVGFLAGGRRAQVTFAAFPGEIFRGAIATINPVVDTQTRTARVTVTVPNPGGRILPGMYARVQLEARKFPDRILVPRAAILERDRRTMLFVFEGERDIGLAKWRYVTTGLANDSVVEIVQNSETSMVAPGEIVLTDGHYTLIHDAKIKVVENVRVAGGRPQ